MKRNLLFMFGCLGTRSALTYLAYYLENENSSLIKLVAMLTLAISIGFITIFTFDLRKTGPEVFGEKIWWNNIRPVHGLLYLLFSVFALSGKKQAWLWLLIDTLLGATVFILHRLLHVI